MENEWVSVFPEAGAKSFLFASEDPTTKKKKAIACALFCGGAAMIVVAYVLKVKWGLTYWNQYI